MQRSLFQAIGIALLTVGCFYVLADDPNLVKTYTLSVEEKLTLIETIEITSEKALQPTTDAPDAEIDSILEEISQLESESNSASST